MKKNFCILYLFLGSTIIGQNLVKNPGFEDYHYLPDTAYPIWGYHTDSTFPAKDWYRAKGVYPMYFHRHAKDSRYTIPSNLLGHYPEMGGNAYIGAYVLSLNDFAAPFSGKFTTPLEKGKLYEVSFYYCFAHLESYFFLDKLEAYISPNNWSADICEPDYRYTFIAQQYDTLADIFVQTIANVSFQSPILNDGKWHKMTGSYKANGGEEYITIGIFYQNDRFHEAIGYYRYYYFTEPNKRKLKKIYKRYPDVLFIHQNPLYSPSVSDQNVKKTGEKSYRDAYYFFDEISVTEIQPN